MHVFFIFGVQGTPAAVAVVVLVEEVVFVVVGDGLLLCSDEVSIDTRFMLTFSFAFELFFAFEFAHAFFVLARALAMLLLTLPTGE